MKSFDTEHISNLPDTYNKSKDSNNYKILEIERVEVNKLRDNLQSIEHILDLNNAVGKTLDLYGERQGQSRGVASDEQYLLLIKAKIMRDLSNGSYKSIVDSICYTFNCKQSQVYIVEKDAPCTVELVALPLEAIINSDFTAKQTATLIEKMLPVAVVLESFLFEGTFEFSNSENDYDEESGFCDVEDGTIGGYLGITSGEENEPILPI